MKLQYILRDDSSVIGKRNIYISGGYGTDLDKIISLLCDHGCDSFVFWFDSEPDADYLSSRLQCAICSTQLVVFPVTNELLCGKSRAITEELPIVLEKNLPCLPIAMPGTDIGELKRFFGDIEYISLDDDGYGELLDHRLSLLTGDKRLEKRVMSSLSDFRVFLSFPAESVTQVYPLMRRIHDLDFCRDISILTADRVGCNPLEDQEIEQLIEDCDAVIVCATSASAERNCMQSQIDFPAIVASAKPCLVIELDDVRRSVTERYFKDSMVIDLENEKRFSNAMRTLIYKRKPVDNSAEQRLALGLAYLYGIGVETDYDRAITLLAFAASSKLLEAQQMLAQMHSAHFGVLPDYDTAVTWQSKAAEQITAKYNAHQNASNAAELSECYNTLSSLYRRAGRTDRAENILLRIRTLCDHVTPSRMNTELTMHYHTCCRMLAEIYNEKNNREDARNCIERALEIDARLIDRRPDAATMRMSALDSSFLGDIFMASNESLTQAEASYRKAYEFFEHLASVYETVPAQYELAEIYEKLAPLYTKTNERERAKDCCQRAVDLTQKLWKTTGTYNSRHKLAQALTAQYTMFAHCADPTSAEQSALSAIEHHSGLFEISRTYTAVKELAADYDFLGNLFRSMSNNDAAKDNYKKSLDLLRHFAEANRSDTEASAAVASAYYTLAKLDPYSDEGKDIANKALSIWQQLYRKTGKRTYQDSMAAARKLINSHPSISDHLSFFQIKKK